MSEQRQLIDPGPAAPRADRRRELDAYLSPSRATAALLDRTPELRGLDLLLDPSCGDGRMAAQIARSGAFRTVHLNDVHEGRLAQARDALRQVEAVGPRASMHDAAHPALYVVAPCATITNPPWNAAGAIVHQALRRTRRLVAMLLRVTWLDDCGASHRAPRGDRHWLVQVPPTRMIVVGRISYSGDGATDSAPSAWFLWLREGPGQPWQRGGIEVVSHDDGAQLGLGVDDAP